MILRNSINLGDFLGFGFMDVIKFVVYCFVGRNLDSGFVLCI
jgi:hypothetical protein